jgi:hypothetical protein
MRISRLLRPFEPGPDRETVAAAADIESKKPLSEEMGFERPFMVGVYVNGQYKSFFDELHLNPNDPERAFKDGGCVREFFRWLTESPEGRKLQYRARSKKHPKVVIYGHNLGGFDALHFLRLLRRPEYARDFDVRIIASGSQLLELEITERDFKVENEDRPFDDDEDDSAPVADKEKQPKRRRLRKWVFRDSMRLMPGSLDSIGKKLVLDTRKIKMNESLGGLSTPTKERKAWEEYNSVDCKTVVGLVDELRKQLDILGGHLKMTLPSSSMDLFRREYLTRFLKAEVIDGKPNPFHGKPGIPRERHFPGCRCLCGMCRQEKCFKSCPNAQQERPPCPAAPYGCLHAWLSISPTGARKGGHTEVFHHQEKEGKLRYYDRNSSYAAAMTEPMPLKLQYSFGPGRGPQTLEECKGYADDGLIGFVEAIVYIPETVNIPPLAVIYDDKLVFPVGTFYGRWDWCELKHIEEIGGHIVLIHRSVWYLSSPLIRSMMEDIFAKRADAKAKNNKPMSETCKLVGNSLYGKFLMSPERDELFSAPIGSEPEGAQAVSPEELAYAKDDEPILWRRPKYNEADYFLPHIGSHITALAREALWLQMQKVESLGGRVYYSDSVTGDRTTIVRSPQNRVIIEPIQKLWERFKADKIPAEKEFAVTDNWQALAMTSDGTQGWFPLKQIIRHQTHKTTWLISNKQGQTSVTTDHGIMCDPRTAIVPEKFVANGANFIKLKATPSTRTDETIDLFEFLKDFSSNKYGNITNLEFEAHDDYITIKGWRTIGGEAIKANFIMNQPLTITAKQVVELAKKSGIKTTEKSVISTRSRIKKHGARSSNANDDAHRGIHGEVRFKRFYRPNTPEIGALLRLLGAYISEGSASFPNEKGNRWLFSIAQNRREWLENLLHDMEIIAPHSNAKIYETSRDVEAGKPGSGMFALRSGAAPLSCFFAALGGRRSDGKKLPSFVYDLTATDAMILWEKLLEGDGHRILSKRGGEIIETGQVCYTTKSQELTAGLSYLLDQLSIEHAINYRADKKVWSLRTRPAGSGRTRKTTHIEIEQNQSKYVYDLEVQGAHTFVDGVGRVLLHNTDSVICDVDMPSGKELGEWKQEHANISRLAGEFDSPKSYRLTSLVKGEYFEDHHVDTCTLKDEEDEKGKPKCPGCATELVHIKGLHKSKHTAENFEKLKRGETIRVPDQPPKLGELMAINFKSYETKSRDKSNLRWRDGENGEEVISKRVRQGRNPDTKALVFNEDTPTIYVEDGEARETTQRVVFSYFRRWRDHVLNATASG